MPSPDVSIGTGIASIVGGLALCTVEPVSGVIAVASGVNSTAAGLSSRGKDLQLKALETEVGDLRTMLLEAAEKMVQLHNELADAELALVKAGEEAEGAKAAAAAARAEAQQAEARALAAERTELELRAELARLRVGSGRWSALLPYAAGGLALLGVGGVVYYCLCLRRKACGAVEEDEGDEGRGAERAGAKQCGADQGPAPREDEGSCESDTEGFEWCPEASQLQPSAPPLNEMVHKGQRMQKS